MSEELKSSIKCPECGGDMRVEIKKKLRLVCVECGRVMKGENEPVAIEKVTLPSVNLEK